MAKQPAAGKTKTRLIPALDVETAAELYEYFLRDKIAQIRDLQNVHPAVAYYPRQARSYFAQIAPDFHLIEQQGINLSARLKNVTEYAFEHGYDSLVLIDSDTVTLPSDYLQKALDRLSDPKIDVTLGPCEDGGYYAIGLKAPHCSLFDIQMSTPTVVADTLKQAERAGLAIHLLPEWWDIDTPTDLRRLKKEISDYPQLATASFLESLEF